MNEAWGEAWPWITVLTAAAVTYLWRGLGVALANRIDPDGRVFQWIGAVAYALLAGLIARLIVLPAGPLAATAMTDRLAAAGAALVIFFLTRRNMLFGVVAGVGVLVLLTLGRTA